MRAKGGARGKVSLGRSLWVGLLGRARPTSPLPLECPPQSAPTIHLPSLAAAALLLLKLLNSPASERVFEPQRAQKGLATSATVLQETDPRSRKA